MFEKIGRLLPSSLNRSGEMSRGVEAAMVVEAAQAALQQTFGEEFAVHAKAASFKNGVLKVTCDRSVYAEAIRLRAQELIDEANSRFGRPMIASVKATEATR